MDIPIVRCFLCSSSKILFYNFLKTNGGDVLMIKRKDFPFGNFNIWLGGFTLYYHRAKAKELEEKHLSANGTVLSSEQY